MLDQQSFVVDKAVVVHGGYQGPRIGNTQRPNPAVREVAEEEAAGDRQAAGEPGDGECNGTQSYNVKSS